MANINKRIFGGDIDFDIKMKLYQRQLQLDSINPNQSWDVFYNDAGEITTNQTGHLGEINFPKVSGITGYENSMQELSSRTPIARLWTAIQLEKVETTGEEIPALEFKKSMVKEGHVYDKKGEMIIEKKIEVIDNIVYTIGNHIFNTFTIDDQNTNPLNPTQDWFLTELEKDKNEFNSPPPGITSISSETTGAGLTKKTSVSFLVHNFHDYDEIYSKYFLRPGAQVFVDFGWDTADLYDPNTFIKNTDLLALDRGSTVEEVLYGPTGYINTSKGDLDVIVGNVTNFSANVKEDGSVACSIDIVSKNTALIEHSFDVDDLRNRVIFSLDALVMNFAAQYFGVNYLEPNWNNSIESMDEFTVELEKFAAANLGNKRFETTEKNEITGVFWHELPGEVISNTENIYVAWGLIEDRILNSVLGIGNDLAEVLFGKEFSVRFDSSNSFVTYNNNLYQRQLAAKDGKDLAFLYPSQWDNTYNTVIGKVPYDHKPNTGATAWNSNGVPGQTMADDKRRQMPRIPLREVFVSLKLIKRAFKSSSSVNQVLKYIIKNLNGNSGNIFNLVLSSNDKNGKSTAFSDRNLIHGGSTSADSEANFYKNLFEFKPQSPNSLVKGYNMSYRTPSGAYSSMLAIQSMSTGNSMFPASEVIDKILAMRGIDINDKRYGISYIPQPGNSVSHAMELGQQDDSIIDINYSHADVFGEGGSPEIHDLLNSFSVVVPDKNAAVEKNQEVEATQTTDTGNAESEGPDPDGIGANRYTGAPEGVKVVNSVYKYWDVVAKKDFFTNKLPVLLPMELSLTIYGISGIEVGDNFKIDYLPERYRNRIFFQVKSVKQSIGSSGWTTNIDTVARFRNDASNDAGTKKQPTILLSRKALADSLKLEKAGDFKKFFMNIVPTGDNLSFNHIEGVLSATIAEDGKIENINKKIVSSLRATEWLEGSVVPGKDGLINYNKFKTEWDVVEGDYKWELDVKKDDKVKIIYYGKNWFVIPYNLPAHHLNVLDTLLGDSRSK